MKTWGKNSKITTQRYKGLGEMNPGQLRETVFKLGDPDPWFNEHMVRVTVNDVHAANTTVSLWMGGSPSQRRERLMQHWDGEVLAVNGAAD
jgi:DNA gyrase subunit B